MVDKRRMDDHRQLINAKLTADWSIGSGQLLTDCQTLIVGNQCEAVLKQRTSHTRQNCFSIEAKRAAKCEFPLFYVIVWKCPDDIYVTSVAGSFGCQLQETFGNTAPRSIQGVPKLMAVQLCAITRKTAGDRFMVNLLIMSPRFSTQAVPNT